MPENGPLECERSLPVAFAEATWDASRFLRYDMPFELSFIVSLLHGAPELSIQTTFLEFVDKEFAHKAKHERSLIAQSLMKARKTKNHELLASILDDQVKKRSLVELILEPPKPTKKVDCRSTDGDTNEQLIGWIGTKQCPCIDGALWHALNEDMLFRNFSNPLLSTAFGEHFGGLFVSSGKGRVPPEIRGNESLIIAANYFVSELAALFLAFKSGCKEATGNRCIAPCRTSVGLIHSQDKIHIPAEVHASLETESSEKKIFNRSEAAKNYPKRQYRRDKHKSFVGHSHPYKFQRLPHLKYVRAHEEPRSGTVVRGERNARGLLTRQHAK